MRDVAHGFQLQLGVFIQHHVLEVRLEGHREARVALLADTGGNIQIVQKQE